MDDHLTRYRDARERYLAIAMGALSGLKALRSRTNLTVTDAELIDRLIRATERLDDAYTEAIHHRPIGETNDPHPDRRSHPHRAVRLPHRLQRPARPRPHWRVGRRGGAVSRHDDPHDDTWRLFLWMLVSLLLVLFGVAADLRGWFV